MRTSLVALLVVLAVVASGCGAKKPKTAADWADGFCSAVQTWENSLDSAKNEFASNPSKDTLKSAATDAKSATTKVVADVRRLGKPPTDDGAEAQRQIDDLTSKVQQSEKTIETAVKSVNSLSNALNAATIVSTNLQTLHQEATTTFNNLKQLDPGGELSSAFEDSSTCQSLGL